MLAEFKELIHIALAGINLPITLLFTIMIIYWLSVILGAMDIDILQFDVDIDMDGDLDADLDAGGGGLNGVMLYFNIGAVPVTVWLSFLIFTGWLLTMLETYYFNRGHHFLIGLAFLIPNLIASMYVAKFGTAPLKKVFEAMAPKNITNQSLIGQRATVVSSVVDQTFGQIQIKTDGAPLTLNARTEDDQKIVKGDDVLILSELEQGTFAVQLFSI